MALLKFFLGNSSDLENIPPIDGYLYFCTDDSNFYIDCYDPAQGAVVRKVVGGDQGEVDIDTSNLVTLDTAQTITGVKTLTNSLKLGTFSDEPITSDLGGAIIRFNMAINQNNCENYYQAGETLLESSGRYSIYAGGPPHLFLRKDNENQVTLFDYDTGEWCETAEKFILPTDFGTITSCTSSFKNIITNPKTFFQLDTLKRTEFQQGKIIFNTGGGDYTLLLPTDEYKNYAGDTIATREWVENYIANNMPTYPAAEEASF